MYLSLPCKTRLVRRGASGVNDLKGADQEEDSADDPDNSSQNVRCGDAGVGVVEEQQHKRQQLERGVLECEGSEVGTYDIGKNDIVDDDFDTALAQVLGHFGRRTRLD
jgi:hypothetical protein